MSVGLSLLAALVFTAVVTVAQAQCEWNSLVYAISEVHVRWYVFYDDIVGLSLEICGVLQGN